MYLDENNVPLSTSFGYVVGLMLIMLVVGVAVYRYIYPTMVKMYFHCAKALYWTLRNWRNDVRGIAPHYHHSSNYPNRTHYNTKKGH